MDVGAMKEEDLGRHLSGLFMYSRQDPVGVNVTYVGEPGRVNPSDRISVRSLPGKLVGKMKLFKSTMSEFQSRQFDKVYRDLTENNFFFQLSRNVSNFVFPHGDVKSGFARYMMAASDGTYRATQEFLTYLSHMSNIKKSSCKFHDIVRLCKESMGNCFIYGEHVRSSGLYVLAACMEAQGFVRYTRTSTVVDPSTGEIREPVAGTNVDRYVLFTGDTQNNFSNMMDLMNSKANAEGRYIKVFISSKIGREGISIKNVRQIHMVSPEWTSSGIFQATSRGIRAKAHDDLKEVLSLREGAGSQVEVDIKVYLHCALSVSNNSIDRNMYFTAERKDQNIQKVMTIAKRVAVNCQLDYDRNVRAGDGNSIYPPHDRWASIGSDESSYRLYMYSTIANYLKDNILHQMHMGSTALRVDEETDVAMCSSSGVQTLGSVLDKFGSLYQSDTMAHAIQWKLRDQIHCMDVYARPGRVEIRRGVVYYSTCTNLFL